MKFNTSLGLFLLASLVIAQQTPPTTQNKHPGIVQWEKIQKINYRQPEYYAELTTLISIYENEKNKSTVDKGVLLQALNHVKMGCDENWTPANFDCINVLTRGHLLYKASSGGQGLDGFFENTIGDVYFRRGDFKKALESYKLKYEKISKYQCDISHLESLTKMLNVYLKLNDKNYFYQYWKIAKDCEKSGLARDRSFKHDLQKNLVFLVFDKSFTDTKFKFASGAALAGKYLDQYKLNREKIQKTMDEMKAQARTRGAGELKALEAQIAENKTRLTKAKLDYENELGKSPSRYKSIKTQSLLNLSNLKIGMTQSEVLNLFNKPWMEKSEKEWIYLLNFREPYPTTDFDLIGGMKSSEEVIFLFDEKNRLTQFFINILVDQKKEQWYVE